MTLPAVVLAAGESRRMGRAKTLLPFGERTVLQRVVDALRAGGCAPIHVVLGHNAREIEASLAGDRVSIIMNPRYRDGMLSSAQAGAAALPPQTPAFVLALADQPLVDPAVIAALIAEWRRHPGTLVLPTVDGRTGHPLVIDSVYRSELLSLPADSTLRDLVKGAGTVRRIVEVESHGPLIDLDTPEEYAAALQAAGDLDGSR